MFELSQTTPIGRRFRHALLMLCLALVCGATLAPSAALAQDGATPAGGMPAPPLLAPLQGFAAVGNAARIVPTAPELSPLAPLVGPVIKHYYADVIDRRTTAELPADAPAMLEGMTPIDMPATQENWVRIDLSEQTLAAYSGQTPIRVFTISSGLPATPTVIGEFRIRAKVRSQLMEGGSRASDNYYNLPNVEWVQYFFEDYGLHGTYWHNDFGRPKSHGCVNMTNADAKWLWEFLGPVWDGSTWQRSTEENPGSLVIVTE